MAKQRTTVWMLNYMPFARRTNGCDTLCRKN